MLKRWFGALAILALAAAGCASTPQGSRERDADAKQFVTHPSAGTIYVYRLPLDRLRDEAILYLDQRLIGQTLPGGYFRLDTVPGHHVLHGMGIDIGKFELDTHPGELSFVELTVIAGHSHFRLVPDAAGRKAIVECCALLENWAPGQRPLFR